MAAAGEASAGFEGFSEDAMAFYRDLAANPTKAFWLANKHRYEAHVRAPMAALVEELAPRFGPAKLFRPYRDVRFAKGASPYKDHQGALAEVASGIGWYVQLGATGLMVGGGYRSHGADQVQRLRAGVDDESAGPELAAIVERLGAEDFDVWGETLKTRPRGVPADHPRLELMRHTDLMVTRELDSSEWLSGPQALESVARQWESIRPLVDWLMAHVGPTTQAPTRRR